MTNVGFFVVSGNQPSSVFGYGGKHLVQCVCCFYFLLVENSSKTLIGLFVVCLYLRFDSWPVAMSVWGSSTEINFQYETLLHYPISGLNDSNYEQHCFCDEIMFVG